MDRINIFPGLVHLIICLCIHLHSHHQFLTLHIPIMVHFHSLNQKVYYQVIRNPVLRSIQKLYSKSIIFQRQFPEVSRNLGRNKTKVFKQSFIKDYMYLPQNNCNPQKQPFQTLY